MKEANSARSVVAQAPGGQTTGLGTAVYFESGGGTLFGWLHRPPAESSDLGLVICKPFGYEATCAHRSIRTFAESAANAGIPTLRFDYLGTGDSSDIGPDDNQVELWTNDVLAAVEELQRASGVCRICLLGIRLGGLLALHAARRCTTAVSLILMAPVHDGPRYVRELRAAKLAADMWDGVRDPVDAGGVSGLEVSGFTLCAPSVAALDNLHSGALGWPEGVGGLVIDSASHHASQAWASQVAEGNGRVKYVALPGLSEMIMRPAQHAEVPLTVVNAVVAWLKSLGADCGSRGPSSAASRNAAAAMRLDGGWVGPVKEIAEHPVFIDAGAMLFGVVTEPADIAQAGRAIVLLNSGADNHIGANRMHVDLARRWAREGHLVLRFDLGGIGDSTTPAGCTEDQVLPSAALEQIRAAIEFIRHRYGVEHISVGGLCSGAYHAFQAALIGTPIDHIFLVNPLSRFWESGTRLDEPEPDEGVRKTYLYASRVFDFEPWQQLIRGAIRMLKLAQIHVSRQLRWFRSALRQAAPRVGWVAPTDLAVQLLDITQRDIRIVFVLAAGEADIEFLKLQAGMARDQLGEKCRIHVIAGGDHIFSRRRWRDSMADVLSDSLGARSPKPAMESGV